jgi:hypothetical protein
VQWMYPIEHAYNFFASFFRFNIILSMHGWISCLCISFNCTINLT